jgi:hypothetical protein
MRYLKMFESLSKKSQLLDEFITIANEYNIEYLEVNGRQGTYGLVKELDRVPKDKNYFYIIESNLSLQLGFKYLGVDVDEFLDDIDSFKKSINYFGDVRIIPDTDFIRSESKGVEALIYIKLK